MSDEQTIRLRRAMAAVSKLQARIAQLEAEAHGAIAVVSMACRFPGGVDSPEGFWQLLDDGRDAITEIPRYRWDVDAVYDPNPGTVGTTYCRVGGFVGEVDRFDPGFFGISPREALTIDPRERLLLETAWEALERGGMPAKRVAGSSTGVYVGILSLPEYQIDALRDRDRIDPYTLLGTTHSAMAGRLSYWLGLHGPNMPVDTACSSSLVAVHLAVQALRTGECDMALAGGVNLLLAPEGYVYFSRLTALSKTGRCHAFSADADGYVRGEGCGMIVLKRLEDAQRDGDPILAVIRSSVVNQDGTSNGFTAPSGVAQEQMLRRALKQAQIEPATIDVVECHGTGTILGDPIEVDALASVYGEGRSPDSPLLLTSVKTNIGHTEGAAGIAGMIKAVLALQHRRVPPSLHFNDRPNPNIVWDSYPVKVATTAISWEQREHPRRIGVSSFGFSGTNAHVILEQAPEVPPSAAPPKLRLPRVPLVLSGHTEEALRGNAERLAARLDDHNNSLLDIAYSLATTRTAFRERAAVSVADAPSAREALRALARGDLPSDAVRATARRDRAVFIFPGQGSQYPGMCRTLLNEPVFREALAACDAAIRPHAGFSVLELLEQDDDAQRSALEKVAVVQPVLFAVAVALSRLWQSCGVEPAAVVGHSQGEVAAAVVAGALSLEEGARVVSVRSRLLSRLDGSGAMVSVGLPMKEVEALLAAHEGLSVAVVNTSESTVVAGDRSRLEALLVELERRNVFCRRIAVDYASHSPQMDPILGGIREELADLAPREASAPFYSTVLGKQAIGTELGGGYWADNLRMPVRMDLALKALGQRDAAVLLEVSAHPLLAAPLGLAGHEAVVGSLHRDADAASRFRTAAAQLYVHGVDVDWERVYAAAGARRTDVPTYAFQRDRYWLEKPKERRPQRGGHPLLGERIELSTPKKIAVWESAIGLEALPYLKDHKVEDAIIFPGAGFVEMALAAAKELFGGRAHVVEGLSLDVALVLLEEAKIVQLACVEDEPGRMGFQISSWEDASSSWVRHARGKLRLGESAMVAPEPLREVRARCRTALSGGEYYGALSERGLVYGPSFQRIARLWVGEKEALGEMQLADERTSGARRYIVPPDFLDGCFQVLMAASGSSTAGPMVPVGVKSVRVRGPLEGNVWSHVWLREIDEAKGSFTGDVFLVDESGGVLVDVQGLRVQRLERGAVAGEEIRRLEHRFHPAPLPERERTASGRSGRVVILADEGGLGDALANALRAEGAAATSVRASEIPLEGSRVFEDLFGSSPCRDIVHLWSLDGPPPDEITVASLARVGERDCGALLDAVQALSRLSLRDAPRLWIVTRGVHQVGAPSTPSSPGPALLWGLGRTIAAEHPELSCTRLDLAPRPLLDEVNELARHLLVDDREDEIALRPEGRFVARVGPAAKRRSVATPVGPTKIDQGATYLVVGGLGGLGLSLAAWLVSEGARHLVLTSRRGAYTTEQVEAVARIKASGAQVRVEAADVSVRSDVERVLERIAKELPPLRGVVHAAGVLDDSLLERQTVERLVKVTAPKVAGAWHLHELTRDQPLDFFVLYASASGLLGAAGQANYAAANAFLDALAHHRRALGLPALSLDWGAFSEVGLAAAQDNRGARLATMGMRSMTPEEGIAVLAEELGGDRVQLGVIPLDLRQWVECHPHVAASSLFSELVQAAGQLRRLSNTAKSLQQTLSKASASERRALVERFLREQVGTVLRMDASRVDLTAPFRGMGLDSLMGLELRNRLETGLGLKLAATLIWTYSNVTALAEHLSARLATETSGDPRVETNVPFDVLVQPAAPMSIAPILSLSHEEKNALLEKTLSAIEEYLK
ncbi:type I polyketide synthase [Sorangium sp. So ce1151]|uniref:type I polyketide synthase n=1 Tax=Sorangium sp. So ce1151 TaxID=3133332 RepID=UPI003F615102